MKTSDFDYNLPQELIAQKPIEPRDHSRLMVVDRSLGTLSDHHFYNLPSFLKPGDLLIFNNSKVFKARLKGRYRGNEIEVFLLREKGDGLWEALLKPGKKVPVGFSIELPENIFVTVQEKQADGVCVLKTSLSKKEMLSFTEKYGEVPLPPYISKENAEDAHYQTIYANTVGSVAAPTAGFHFTENLFKKLTEKNIQTAFVTLHVGIGTFRPMQGDTLEEHTMHEEWFTIPEETARAITKTKKNGGRVIAVGTTTLRALEAAEGKTVSTSTTIFIKPGYQFKIADGLVTNFHLPKSTLLVLVSAFAGTDFTKKAYNKAISDQYRFYSFGDGMLIL